MTTHIKAASELLVRRKKKISARAISALALLSCSALVLSYQSPPPAALSGNSKPPEWAYGTGPAESLRPAQALSTAEKAAADHTPLHLPESRFAFTKSEANNPYNPADWYPGDHPAMPDIVAHGRKAAGIWACDFCHFPNGRGKPENAAVSGLPVSYFVHQMEDFRSGLRHSADPGKKNTNLMVAYAKAMSDQEIRQAAEYFSAMPWNTGTNPWVRVVETKTVPRTRLSSGLYIPIEGAVTEPLGKRLIEVPQEPERTEVHRDPRSGFIAYVPFGTLKNGRILVETGGHGRTEACAECHGPKLQGIGPVPGIGGRSASYIARQLYDMQKGTRKGEWCELMKPVVAKLTQEEILQVAAYTASVQP